MVKGFGLDITFASSDTSDTQPGGKCDKCANRTLLDDKD